MSARRWPLLVCSLSLLTAVLIIGGRWSTRLQADDDAPAAADAKPAPPPETPVARKPGARVGRKLANFILTDAAKDAPVGLADYADKPWLALYFLNNGCPIANKSLPELIAAQTQHAGDGLQILAIHSQRGEAASDVAKHAAEFKLNFPALIDADQALADALGVERTATLVLLDSRRVVRYFGRLDDRHSYTASRPEPTRRDALEALGQLIRGEAVTVAETPVEGCLLTRRTSQDAGDVPTYVRDVAPILQAKCAACHHPADAAPFALQLFDDAERWSAMIREVVLDRRMPPWHADPRYGAFSNSRRLEQTEIATLVRWIDAGAPRGTGDEPPPAKFNDDGWRIGTPDVVFEMPKEVTVPSQGTVPYLYYQTETKFDEDKWIEAAECRPGNRAVVHHIVLAYRAPGERTRDLESKWIVAYAPGDTGLRLPEGVGRKIPKGATLVWQMHYTPTGKEETDRSQVAFRFCKTPPKFEAKVHGLKNNRFSIPPGAPHHLVEATMTVPADSTVVALFPHMHLRGKAFEYHAKFPDGREEVLLSVPQYDFNWQTSYRFAEPLTLPRGTQLRCRAWFDNSKGNPANPDPSQTVRWGDQTWEEMMIGYMDYLQPVE